MDISFRVSVVSQLTSVLPLLITQAAPARPNFRVNLGKGTVTIGDDTEEAAKRALAAATGVDLTGRPAAGVKPRDVKLKDNGSVKIAAMTEEDCIDATKLIMELFFKGRPQDFLAKDRLKAEQAERVYGGLANGVNESNDRLLLAAKVGGRLIGVAEVSLPGESRFETPTPSAPNDEPYVADVAVAPNQRNRGIGKALLRACEAAVAARGDGQMYLHAKQDNEAGLALFQKSGYTELGRSEEASPLAQFGIGEVGHVLLTKELNASEYN